ncbi:MAG TPA: histidine phosphatase family protein [Syntrophomonadaceae bacterium]|nr:histidine phosphatase family protein [Syntrophomonadaceae bacterium]
MKIGLIRHFTVNQSFSGKSLMTPDEYCQWLEDYDRADIHQETVNLDGVAWERCYCSDASRAIKTAQRIYPGEINIRQNLRELQIYPVSKNEIRLPLDLWVVLGRFAWLLDHPSQKEQRREFKQRLSVFVDELMSQKEQSMLVVSHGGFMYFLRQELIRRGFSGPWFFIPPNGKLYIYERR